MTVLVILSLLAAIAVPTYQDIYAKSKQRDALVQMMLLHGSLRTNAAKNGQYLVGSLNRAQLNTALSINLVDQGVTYSYTGADGSAYSVLLQWADPNKPFALAMTSLPLDNGASPPNPCCFSGTCYPSLIPTCS